MVIGSEVSRFIVLNIFSFRRFVLGSKHLSGWGTVLNLLRKLTGSDVTEVGLSVWRGLWLL